MSAMKIVAAKSILRANDRIAADNRQDWSRAGVFVVNVVGSPGCGKTTLLEGLFSRLGPNATPAVIEGDIAGQVDAERIDRIGVPVVQINTDGMCHLEAGMIAEARAGLESASGQMLFIENVGNLVCTAGFDLGEHLRLVILSVAEGDDKLIKYPAIFQRSDALVVSKVDLLPHCRFDLERVGGDMRRLAPAAEVFHVSAVRGDGLDALAQWLLDRRDTQQAAAADHGERSAAP
jgi:hydrogenase nickel incorporation protein HypB